MIESEKRREFQQRFVITGGTKSSSEVNPAQGTNLEELKILW